MRASWRRPRPAGSADLALLSEPAARRRICAVPQSRAERETPWPFTSFRHRLRRTWPPRTARSTCASPWRAPSHCGCARAGSAGTSASAASTCCSATSEGCRSDCGYCGLARTRPGSYGDKSFIRVEWPLVRTDDLVERMARFEPEPDPALHLDGHPRPRLPRHLRHRATITERGPDSGIGPRRAADAQRAGGWRISGRPVST